jgi:outer membrane protein assembly factor BamB
MRRIAILGVLLLTAACSKPIVQEWEAVTEAGTKCTPLLTDEALILGNESGYVHAIGKNGVSRWSFTAHRDVIGTPVMHGDIVMFGSTNNIFYGVNASSGREVWKYVTRSRIKGDPVLWEGRVIFGSYDKRLYALDARTGKLAWQFPAPRPAASPDAVPASGDGPAQIEQAALPAAGETGVPEAAAPVEPVEPGEFSYATPLVLDGVVYVGNLDGYLYAVEAATGRLRWRFQTGAGITSGAIHDAGVLYFGSNDHNVYALDLATRQPKWKFETRDEVNASPRLADGVLYVGGVDSNFYAIDAATGTLKWTFPTRGRIVAAAALYENLVFVGSGPGDGTLYAIDRESGRQFWAFASGSKIEADPVIEGNRLYLALGDGRVIAFRIKKTR